MSSSPPTVTSMLSLDGSIEPLATDGVRSSSPFSTIGSSDGLPLGFLWNHGNVDFDFDFDLLLEILTRSESESHTLSSEATSLYNSGNGKFSR